MARLDGCLNFARNTEETFAFDQSVFGGELTPIVRFKEMPMEGVTMVKDTLESLAGGFVRGNNACLSIHVESKEEADRVFADLLPTNSPGRLTCAIGHLGMSPLVRWHTIIRFDP